MSLQESIYEIADELRGIASSGLHFSSDPYDRERYEKVLALSARLIGSIDERSPDEILVDFEDNLAHLSPLVGASSVVQLDSKILLIQRTDNGLWGVPGGLVEVGEVLSEAAIRELEEEAGVSGSPVDLLAVFDSRLWKSKSKTHLYHFVFLVEADNPKPTPGPEALSADFFSEADLPELSPGQDRRIPVIFRILREEISRPYFDGRSGSVNITKGNAV
ncbi:MAG: NUDIX hydrolase N-terminal domain-containing protein [Chloroflexota bacterium]|nr:NUDIX hydrolase N-terminal domain-containing protein [Chloroflexota bacterium]